MPVWAFISKDKYIFKTSTNKVLFDYSLVKAKKKKNDGMNHVCSDLVDSTLILRVNPLKMPL